MNLSNIIQELKRRNVFKVAIAYAVAGWLYYRYFDYTKYPYLLSILERENHERGPALTFRSDVVLRISLIPQLRRGKQS